MSRRIRSGEAFTIPTTFTVLVSNPAADSFVAHALDCDVVCESNTLPGALEKLKIAVKTYIEYGVEHGWNRDILFPAPDECWDAAAKSKPLPPIWIEIDQSPILCHAGMHESGRAA